MYLQRGIRWIPNYKVTIDGQGKATVKLQATLLNELTDLEDVTCHLVIGVPTFQFKDTADPMALQQNLAQLSQYFRESDPTSRQSPMLSNAIMTQAPRMAEYRARAAARPADLGPEMRHGQAEDLHIFTVKHVTLKKGQRMVVPVAEFMVPYRDVYRAGTAVRPAAGSLAQFQQPATGRTGPLVVGAKGDAQDPAGQQERAVRLRPPRH